MLFFSWLRLSIRNAVLGGVQDALDHLNAQADADNTSVLLVNLNETRVLPANGEPKRKVVRT
jgi:hypothetical protein